MPPSKATRTKSPKKKSPTKRPRRGVDAGDGGEVLSPSPVASIAFDSPEVQPPTQPLHGFGGRIRTRTEIRAACAHLFDVKVREMLSNYLDSVRDGHQVEDPITKKTSTVYYHKDVALVTGIGQLLVSVGVGTMGVNQIDPADIPNLPAPVFQSADPDAPLPDGKAG